MDANATPISIDKEIKEEPNTDFTECSLELKEAVASIIFAAPRCSDLPDLLSVRNLFAAKYALCSTQRNCFQGYADSLKSMDWIARLKIAIGVAE
ncbi:hypothetical protein L6452_06584 [Arctium lappa]|uniref:Uncharacterized protein n=1 Tax=Arctium lappa TaxID=4217 RepID=A0ACB9EKN1_ARCLA|nr:hypothetical protein L6452_06584 [Arctium lappa]